MGTTKTWSCPKCNRTYTPIEFNNYLSTGHGTSTGSLYFSCECLARLTIEFETVANFYGELTEETEREYNHGGQPARLALLVNARTPKEMEKAREEYRKLLKLKDMNHQ